MIRVDIFHHFPDISAEASFTKQVHEILAQLARIEAQGARLMTKIDDLNAVLGELKTALADMADDIDKLIEQAQGGVTPADADKFLADLTAVRDSARSASQKFPAPPPPTP